MADEIKDRDFFQDLLKAVKELLDPALAIFSDEESKTELLGTLGLDPDTDPGSLPSTTSLDQYIQSEAEEADAFMLIAAMADLTQVTLAIEGVIRAAIAAEENPDFAVDELMGSFFNILLMDYVRRQSPGVFAFANLVTTLTAQTAAEGGTPNFVEGVIVEFFKKLGKGLETEESTKAVSDGVFILFAASLFGIKLLLDKFDIDALTLKMGYGYEGITESSTSVADTITNRTLSYSVTVKPVDDPDNQGTAFNSFAFIPEDHGGEAFITDLSGEIDMTIPLTDELSLKFDLSGEGIFRIGTSPEASAGKNNRIKITFNHKRDKAGLAYLSRKPEMKIGFGTYSIAMTATPDDFEIAYSGKMPFQFKRDKSAGFPMSLLPEKIDEKIPLDFGYSLKRDFFFGSGGGNAGSSADPQTAQAMAGPEEEPDFIEKILAKIINMIDLRIPIHKDIGGILGIQLLNLKTGVVGNFETITLETSLDFWVKFGPVLTISVSRLGIELTMTEREDSGGLFGYDLMPEFKPPNGAGVRVNAEVIKGGGFLYLDHEKGEYFGSLELEFKGLFTLKAVGIINTIMPDGSKGFSMLILITAEFSPIQLGFGFTLSGVGGLLGVDRTTEVEALRIGIRTNAIKSILFPEDVVGNISRIINDLREIFPIKQGQFLVGLMAKLGWGSPTLIHIELGLIVEIPDPKIMLLGVIRVSLPDEDAAVLKLQVNFLGVLDFQNQFIYFEAHLFDSILVGFPLTGSLAFAVAWGEQSVFAISVGGFHPDFKDYPVVPTLPGAFRGMARIGFSLLSGKNPRFTVECYMAVTSNSVQFGAKAELLASGPMGFNLYGMLGFDALFIFDPFSFSIKLEATLAIRKGKKVLFGISFKGVLEGPTPWHIEGKVTFSVLFFDVTISFSETWGDPQVQIVTETQDLLALMQAELDDIRNWQVVLPAHQHMNVTHKELEGPEEPLIVFPFGQLQFSQRTIPLNYQIEKYGTRKPLNENKFQVTEVKVGERVEAKDDVKELFAPEHYTKLSEREKLSRKSFERMDSGFSLRDTGKLLTAQPHLDPVDLNYELNYTEDDEQLRPVATTTHIVLQAFAHMSREAAVSKSDLGWKKSIAASLNQPGKVGLAEDGFAIANTSNLHEFDGGFRASTYAEAKAQYDQLVKEDPTLEDKIQVVESFELNN
ncbi:hypothetical protein NC796_12060 [Aliifodinibius sp. S!AR15-10]|uniref:DUF6603 domain-containing protein n=1 Tax=Aliifodinibius sp. S!AR15-10 TaxID=2950437 RepID=UPI002857C22B|nr:DUF6603 domain-containing protein [Aliifodinibius sp. S!AR15-10]MDR8391883.1 hypothetical protein [Aliifodinibius sp. S!AR15-10]